MRRDGVRVSAMLMALALVAMLVCLFRFSAVTMAVFLGPGLLCATASLLIYVVAVLRDLRRRRAL